MKTHYLIPATDRLVWCMPNRPRNVQATSDPARVTCQKCRAIARLENGRAE